MAYYSTYVCFCERNLKHGVWIYGDLEENDHPVDLLRWAAVSCDAAGLSRHVLQELVQATVGEYRVSAPILFCLRAAGGELWLARRDNVHVVCTNMSTNSRPVCASDMLSDGVE